jgi:hypothetical protein
MKRLERNMQQFLIDANVFVAAIKNPEKKAGALEFHRKGRKDFVTTLCVLCELCGDLKFDCGN